ncbi:MAG TPA: DNA-protecting protein DprA, partial [Candidatus Tenderia electrophaga]|nr:DNA-protecting protein DprA [Candidatus Tenderia electrophaga]
MDATRAKPPSQAPETDTSLAAWLALLHCPGIGPRRYSTLLEYYHQPSNLLDAGADEINQLDLPDKTRQWLKQPDWKLVENDLNWLNSHPDHHIINIHEQRYPAQLRQIDSAPALLFAIGDSALLSTNQLGIVGSRNPSAGGKENSFHFAQSLSQAGLTITSGMALGIDAAAHKGALANNGKTIAVTGTGLDRVYPARHRQLAHDIATNGTIISEFPIGTPPLPDHFPRRNRIISGLSLGILVVEAAPKSGSLISARLANEQGLEVFAIPGSIHNPLARGCHQLIRQGAKLVETTTDILEELGVRLNNAAIPQPSPATDPQLDERSL